MTDGCGFISVDLARQIPFISNGAVLSHENKGFIALAIQCRIVCKQGLFKGVLITNPELPPGEFSVISQFVLFVRFFVVVFFLFCSSFHVALIAFFLYYSD